MENLETLEAKDLKVIATEMWLEFNKNAWKDKMLELIQSPNNDESTSEKESNNISGEYEVVTPVKRDGEYYKPWDNIEYFEWVEKLIEDWIIRLSE